MGAGEWSVAVVVPTFDRREAVLRATESVLGQTLAPREVVVVDDGSTDGTAEALVESSAAVRVIRQENRGVSAARNRGIAATTSSWIAFLDSDDTWLPEKLERQVAALRRRPDVKVCHTDEIWIRDGNQVLQRRVHRKHGGWIFERCLPRCAISPSSVILQRSVLDAVGGFDEELPACEDYDLWLRVTSRYEVLLVDEPLVRKTGGHADQLSRRYPAMDRFRLRALEKILSSGALDERQRAAVVATLRKKARIYAAGAERRGRAEEAAAVQARAEETVRRALGAGGSTFPERRADGLRPAAPAGGP